MTKQQRKFGNQTKLISELQAFKKFQLTTNTKEVKK